MRSNKTAPPTTETVRQVFTDRRSYSLSEVAQLFGIDVDLLAEQIRIGELEAVSDAGEPRLPWREVAHLALRRWPLTTIFDALGSIAFSHLPQLLRPTIVTVILPAYQARMLEVLAGDEHTNVSTFLQVHLLDLASAVDIERLEREVPGFTVAMRWPDE